MKTIKEWFDELPPSIAKKALRNTNESYYNMPQESLSAALYCAFIWQDTKEGFNYWRKQCFKSAL